MGLKVQFVPTELYRLQTTPRSPLTPNFLSLKVFYLNGTNRFLAKSHPGGCGRGLNGAICAIFRRFWPFFTVFRGKKWHLWLQPPTFCPLTLKSFAILPKKLTFGGSLEGQMGLWKCQNWARNHKKGGLTAFSLVIELAFQVLSLCGVIFHPQIIANSH